MNEMWIALERYQPFADKRGFGSAWLKMTTERTADATRAATAARAMWAGAAWQAAEAANAAEEAIQRINRAIALEETK